MIWHGYNTTYPCVINGVRVDAATGENQTSYLLLRSVSQLEDDEILQATSIHQDYPAHIKKLTLYKEELQGYLNDAYVYQYLLRIGILLPFTYLNENNQPVTLQPDEIISKGWAKLV